MNQAMNQWDIVREFVLQSGGHVSFGQRGGDKGYTKVFGPNADPNDPESSHISIEHGYDGVSISDELASDLEAFEPRGDRRSAGPGLGRFKKDIVLNDPKTNERYASEKKLVEALINAAQKLRAW